MPSLICCSPTILDQSFPRDNQELNRVLLTFGELQSLLEQDKINILITRTLRDFVLDFDWSNQHITIVIEIYNLLNQWLLQRHSQLVDIDTETITNHTQHPIPNTVKRSNLTDLWSDEIGKILVVHDASVNPEYCIGIACENAFSGLPMGQYDVHLSRCFPLIGPANLNSLKDSYYWDIPKNLSNQMVTFDDAYKNCFLIGATEIEDPKGSSHYMVKFPHSRSWPLDSNHRTINDRFLKELVPITSYPFEVIKYALLNGSLPSYQSYFRDS